MNALTLKPSTRSPWTLAGVVLVCVLAWGCDPGSLNHIRKGETTEAAWRQIAAPPAPAPLPPVEPAPVEAPPPVEAPVDNAAAPPPEEGEGPRKVPAEAEPAPEEAEEATPPDGEPPAKLAPADALDVELEP